MESILDTIRYEEHYGKSIVLWVFSPVRTEWITVDAIAPCDFQATYDVNNQAFLRGCREWLTLGAFWFLEGSNPNTEKGMNGRVYLPPEWLEKRFGIRQDSLDTSSLEEASQRMRDVTETNHISRAQKKAEEAKLALAEASKKETPLDKAIREMREWCPKSNYPDFILKVLQNKGYEIEEQGDQLRIKSEGS